MVLLLARLLLVAGAALAAGCVGVPRPDASWWTYQANFLRTASAAAEFRPPLVLAWQLEPVADLGSADMPPVFGRAKVFSSAGLNPGITRAVSLSGEVLWSFQTGPADPVSLTQYGSLAVANGRVYGVFNDYSLFEGHAMALRESDGTVAWSRTLPEAIIMYSPLIVQDAMAVTTQGSGGHSTIWLLRNTDGSPHWSLEIDDDQYLMAAPSVNIGLMLFSGVQALHAIRLNRQRAWRYDYGGRLWVWYPLVLPRANPEAPAVVVVAGVQWLDAPVPGADTVEVHAVDGRTGMRLWRKTRPVDFTNNYSYALPAGDTLVLLAGTHVWAVRASDGELLWERRVPRRLEFAPALAGDILYFTDGVALNAWHAGTGDEAWSLPLPVPAPLTRGAIAIDQGLLVVSHGKGMLAFRRAP